MDARPTSTETRTPTAPPDPSTARPAQATARGHTLRLGRRRCLVVPMSGDRRPLARAVNDLLATELPELELILDDDGDRFDAVWLCGAGDEAGPLVGDLRQRHNDALLVVTGRGLHPGQRNLVDAGADRVLSWPSYVGELREAFRSVPIRR